MLHAACWRVCSVQGDTLDYLGVPGLHVAGAQGVLIITISQFLLMVSAAADRVWAVWNPSFAEEKEEGNVHKREKTKSEEISHDKK